LNCSLALAACVGDASVGEFGVVVFTEQAVATRTMVEKSNGRPGLGIETLGNFH
jgi:hypothetical protein